jgi:hypothetical protein
MPSCWINICTQAPPFGELVEVVPCHDENDELSYLARYISLMKDGCRDVPDLHLFKCDDGGCAFVGVSHWRPIPKLPESELQR